MQNVVRRYAIGKKCLKREIEGEIFIGKNSEHKIVKMRIRLIKADRANLFKLSIAPLPLLFRMSFIISGFTKRFSRGTY